MKKNLKKDQQRETPRRLSLNRETLQSLDDPSLLEKAEGGTQVGRSMTTTEQPTGCT